MGWLRANRMYFIISSNKCPVLGTLQTFLVGWILFLLSGGQQTIVTD